jgi:protein arginine kinase activator
MKCDNCPETATVHLTDIIGGKKHERHYCKDCAEQQHIIAKKELNLPAIVQSLVGKHIGQMTDELARLTCPACGIKYMEFRAEGRLGCPHDYEAFRVGLEPLLKRIHRNLRHVGKAPKRCRLNSGSQTELLQLRTKLRCAVDSENYEEAARLRDLLRQKESHG